MTKPKSLDERTLARQRWARAGWIYGTMLALAVLFIGPFYVAFLASAKDNPLEWPFRFSFPQTQAKNWGAAWRLGSQGAGNPWTGGFAPGATIPFEVSYFVPEGTTPALPTVTVPERRAGAGLSAVFPEEQASKRAAVSQIEEVNRKPLTLAGTAGQVVTYRFSISYPKTSGNQPTTPRLPLDIEAPRGQSFYSATLDPNRLERRGRIASWDNAAPGFIGYVFRNYVRCLAKPVTPTQARVFSCAGR
jgi:multiple sugar transport system permease protein